MPSGDLAFIICNVNALSEEVVLRSNLESPALRVYRALLSRGSTSSASVPSGAKHVIPFTSLARSANLIHTTCLVIRCCALLPPTNAVKTLDWSAAIF
jgi:hypothetical protein